MLRKYFKYILLAIFLLAIFLIVFLQFNSNRSINLLINGNEQLMGELRMKNKLQRLLIAMVSVENKVHNTVLLNDTSNLRSLQGDVTGVSKYLVAIDSAINDPATDPMVLRLQQLATEKINSNVRILDTFNTAGRTAAAQLLNVRSNLYLMDTIKGAAARIDSVHEATVTRLTQQADTDGARAKTLGTSLALLAAIAAIIAFGYVSYKIRQQQQLIHQLNESEKKARDAVAVKETFVANMSHEVRTPINAILGFSNLLSQQPLPGEAARHVQFIRQACDNLSALVNDILDFSKIEAGMLRIESVPFSISALLHSVETMFRYKAEQKGLGFSLLLDAAIPDLLSGDAVRLNQVLINLTGNALKFTHSGSIAIAVSPVAVGDTSAELLFTVSDTGIGIPPQKQAVIFNRFQQAEDTITRQYGGTGLGLSIVKDLVHLQNGTLTLQSEPGKGSTFSFSITYGIVSEAGSTPVDEPVGAERNPVKAPVHILVAEDNELNQQLLRHLLTQWQYPFTITANGQEAIAELQRSAYDLVLMDIQMPVMDGYTAAQAIRSQLQLRIPIIAMTANALAGEREKCLSMGMNDYITKPIPAEELRRMILLFTANAADTPPFRYIDLSYMREISNGSRDYEKTITGQFIELLPGELAALQGAADTGDTELLRKTAHHIKATIAIMGLTATLEKDLDALEYNTLTATEITGHLHRITVTCHGALEEARQLLTDYI